MGQGMLAPQRAGTIRRVVRRGRTYICGLCRGHYDRAGEAQGCVKRCWQELLSFDPVIERRRGLSAAFRCRFCARDFAARGAADRCAADCRAAHEGRFAREQSLVEQAAGAVAPPSKRRRSVLRGVARPAPRVAPRAAPARPTPAPVAKIAPPLADIPPINADVTTPAPPAAAPAPQSAAPEAEEARVKKAKDRAEAYYRDGARYVCKTCNVKYFTKDEVYKCFDGH